VHTFVECIGFTESHALNRFEETVIVYNAFAAQDTKGMMMRQSIVPHAPYSVSTSVFALIDKHQPNSLISIHNQEAEAENEFYTAKTGAVKELLGGFGIDDSFFAASGKTSLQSYTEWLSPHHRMLFVHNTYTAKDDIQFAAARFSESFWCLCPNANLYIENRLPDIGMLIQEGVTICIGTDSLASNHQLCVLSELQTLKENYNDLDWEVLLNWGTLNGALALNMHERVGSIEVGKQPGIINIKKLESGKPEVHRII
jgi:cytosine/adenosine deaminase-related metal-dependent hydrolase